MKKFASYFVLSLACSGIALGQGNRQISGLITIQDGTYKLSEVLAQLKGFGVSYVIAPDASKADPSIHVNIAGQPVRQSLDAIAAAVGDHWSVYGDIYVLRAGSGLLLESGAGGQLGGGSGGFGPGQAMASGNAMLAVRSDEFAPAWVSSRGTPAPLVRLNDGWKSDSNGTLILIQPDSHRTATWYKPMVGSRISRQDLADQKFANEEHFSPAIGGVPFGAAWGGTGAPAPLVNHSDGWAVDRNGDIILPQDKGVKVAIWYKPMNGSRIDPFGVFAEPKQISFATKASFLDSIADSQWKRSWDKGFLRLSDLDGNQLANLISVVGHKPTGKVTLIDHGRRLVIKP